MQPWENIWVESAADENNTMDNYIAKVDQVLGNEGSDLSFNYIHDDQFGAIPGGQPHPNVPVGERRCTSRKTTRMLGIDWIHTQRDNLLFDVHTSYQRYWRV
jgi:hypothetical protein